MDTAQLANETGTTNGRLGDRIPVPGWRRTRSPARAQGGAPTAASSVQDGALWPPGMSLRQRLSQRARMWVWEQVMATIAEATDVPQVQVPPVESDWVKPIKVGRRYPGLSDTPMIFSELTPPSERHTLFESAAVRATLWLKEWYSLGRHVLQPYTGVGAPYPERFARLQPPPRIPEDFTLQDKLAGIAQRGPFSFQTRKAGTDEYEIDLTLLESYTPRAPFIPAGGLARFRRADDRLVTVSVDFGGRTYRPGEPGWALTEKRFLAGLNSYTTFIEHLLFLHIATAGTWGIVARMALSTRHPLRVLLQPFTQETNRVNNYNIDGLILSENSNVPLYSGYSLEQSNTLLRIAAQGFDVRVMDPEKRAEQQGQLNDGLFPTVQSAVDLFRIYQKFTDSWCETYLQEIDLETRIFCRELDHRVANGVKTLIGIDDWQDLRREHVSHLLATGAFAASVGHHVVNDLTRDYMLAFHLMPPALDGDGRPSLGIVLEKQASVLTAGIKRYHLISEAAMPNDTARKLWDGFQQELKAYQRDLAADPVAAYRIHPRQVCSSIHA